MLAWFERLTFAEFLAFLAGVNLAMYAGSWALVAVLQRVLRERVLNAGQATTTAREYLLSFVIVAINIAVGIPGWFLWKAGLIVLAEQGPAWFVLDLLLLLVFFDLTMYVLHRVMHWGVLYRLVHSKHHDHVDVSGISLYVMNPAESLGFGALLIAFLMAHETGLYALSAFLVLNWAYGTMGHSGIALRCRVLRWLVGDTEFHHRHHSGRSGNYGFYTPLWDRLFGTAL